MSVNLGMKSSFLYVRYILLTLALSLLIPIVFAVLLCRSVPSNFFPCNVIQPNAVQPKNKDNIQMNYMQEHKVTRSPNFVRFFSRIDKSTMLSQHSNKVFRA